MSRGSNGEIYLGGKLIDLESLRQNAGELIVLSQSLNRNADILLYGCEVGNGINGYRFMQTLSTITGADVAASDDLTGSAELGGDWNLEQSIGIIESMSPFIQHQIVTFPDVL